MKGFISAILLMFTLTSIAQEKTTISGYVLDSNTKEPLIGANVVYKYGKYGVSTNEFGFFSLIVPTQDSIKIAVSFVGYRTNELTIGVEKRVSIYLEPGISLGAVQVFGNSKRDFIRENQTGAIKLQSKQIQKLPNFFGEADIIKVIQMMPGVQSGGEGQTNFYVRGGGPDQNLILLDGMPLYYVSHFGGFISTFNADAISNVDLIKGGFPARYGSRLSSVLDIKMKNGNRNRFSGSGTIGLLTSKVLLEGPIVKEKSSFLVSFRKRLVPVFKVFGDDLDYDFYDLNVKLSYEFSEKDKLFLSGYLGNDQVGVKSKSYNDDYEQNDKRETNWGNNVWSLTWNHIFSERLFCNNIIGISQYRNGNDFYYDLTTDSTETIVDSKIDSKIEDINIASNFSYLVNPSWNVRFGPTLSLHTFVPNTEHYFVMTNDKIVSDSYYNSEEKAIEPALYCENDIKTKYFGANLGLRYSSYHINDQNYFSFEPRLLLNFIASDNFSIKYAYSKMNQYIHMLSYSGIGMPTDYWMPTNKEVKPQNSEQHSISINKTFSDGQFQVSLEGYHKQMKNLIAFIPGQSLVGHLDNWTQTIAKNGRGESNGLELLVQKLTGKTTGWIAGTISKTDRQFDDLNNGQSFPFKYDRLLDISIVLTHEFNEKWSVSGNWNYGSGYPVTLPTERYNTSDGEVYAYEAVNSFRMRDYHRLDLAFNYTYPTSWGESTWTLSVFNVYNRRNPYYYYFEREVINVADNHGVIGVPGDVKLYQKSLFPFFPSFAYSFKF
ncbi:MAG: TonB-dependent receptor plug domain-containing protein [Bacteroidales bacterium]|nr:TonB-dependent receptor plug domain-containing protein [Bacteroidales bacterium]